MRSNWINKSNYIIETESSAIETIGNKQFDSFIEFAKSKLLDASYVCGKNINITPKMDRFNRKS